MSGSAWQEQQAAMLDAVSKQYGEAARAEWIRTRNRELNAVRAERSSKRKAIDTCRKKFDKLSAAYLRHEGTTYEGWQKYGPKRDWDELVEASKHEHLWDRLVETFDTRKAP
jgi:hypothetical protein